MVYFKLCSSSPTSATIPSEEEYGGKDIKMLLLVILVVMLV